MCVRAHVFFPAGRSGDAILNCYRLAKFYSRHPREFLELTLEEVDMHMRMTDKLLATSDRRG